MPLPDRGHTPGYMLPGIRLAFRFADRMDRVFSPRFAKIAWAESKLEDAEEKIIRALTNVLDDIETDFNSIGERLVDLHICHLSSQSVAGDVAANMANFSEIYEFLWEELWTDARDYLQFCGVDLDVAEMNFVSVPYYTEAKSGLLITDPTGSGCVLFRSQYDLYDMDSATRLSFTDVYGVVEILDDPRAPFLAKDFATSLGNYEWQSAEEEDVFREYWDYEFDEWVHELSDLDPSYFTPLGTWLEQKHAHTLKYEIEDMKDRLEAACV